MTARHGLSEPAGDRPRSREAAASALRRAAAAPAGRLGGVAALQRSAGNAAVGALLAGRLRSPGGDKVADIERALAQVQGSDPDVPVVEKGLKAAQEAGVPVDLDGADQKPPASALAVTRTGFGPEQVAAKKPVPPPKPTPAASPLGKAAARAPRPPARAARPAPRVRPAPATGLPPATAGPLAPGQRLEPPAPPSRTTPQDDPAFVAVTGQAKALAAAKKHHAPASAKAAQAQGAALAPADDVAAQGLAAKVDTMEAQPAGSFDKKAFIEAVKAAITAKTPSTLAEADSYHQSGRAGEVKGEVKGLVGQGKDASTKDVEQATDAPPDTSKAVPKQVTPLVVEQPGPPGAVPPAGAVPRPAPPEQVNLEAGKHQADQALAEGGVSERQLATSGEPEFEQALADKRTAAEHASTAPQAFRAQEQATLAQTRAGATAASGQAVAGMHGAKAGALAALATDQGRTKSRDEQQRAAVTARIQEIYAATEKEVRTVLEGIDPKVEQAFEKGEAAARASFEQFVEQKMAAYKLDRYGGWLGGLRWAKDKLVGMPDKVDEFFAAGRERYLQQMDGVISTVADIVAVDLGRAKQRIAAGRAEIASYVKTLPRDLAKVGAEAAEEIGDRFASLEEEVSSKQEALVDALATKYVEARQGLDDRIEEMQAANAGLVDKAVGAIKAVVDTIKGLAAMLSSVLARAAAVVDDIVSDPVGFLGNLVAGVKGGILRFKDNILDHLKKGLTEWLFGALAEGGVELPETFDLKGILKLVASVFGLTWTNIRGRIVRKVGDKAMAAIEGGVEIFRILSGPEGLGGLWQMVVEKVGDLKATIMGKVEDFVVTRVITAGVTWLISLLNPAAAFVKACKLIYDVVMFFVSNGERIMAFVNTVLDSVADIVRGNVGGVVAKIENVLGQMVPLLISFLASVLGLGNIGAKIREIVDGLQRPVTRAVDWIIGQGLKLAGPLIRGVKGIGAKAKAKVAKVKDKALAKVRGGDDSPAGKQQRLDLAVAAARAATQKYADKPVSGPVLRGVLGVIKTRHGLTTLEPVRQGDRWAVHAVVNPETTVALEAKPPAAESASAGVPPQRHLPPAYREHGVLRRRLFETGSGWSTLRNAINEHMTNELFGAFDALMGFSRAERRDQLVQWVGLHKIPPEILAAFDAEPRVTASWLRRWLTDNVSWHVDHVRSLAEYWIRSDHNAGDTERRAHTTDLANLNWITARANLGKGSAPTEESGETQRFHFLDKPWVGPDFTSARAEGGRAGARTIDGEPFRDEHGTPLT